MATVYEVLGLEPTADFNLLKKAYREKARISHPDRGGDAEEFKVVAKVWELLDTEAKAQLYFDQFSAQAIKPDWTSSHANYQPGSSSYRTPSPTRSSPTSSSFFKPDIIPQNPTVSRPSQYFSTFDLYTGGFAGFFKQVNDNLMAYLESTASLISSTDPLDKKLGFEIEKLQGDIWPGAHPDRVISAFKGILNLMVNNADLHSATDNKKYFCLNQLAEFVGKPVTLEAYHTVLAEYARAYVTVDSVALLMAMERQPEPSSSVPLLD
ncbi:J domain-containing protein [Legionella bononiensis]|uniref:DnaJ domain-containing protein n=1 Tax=Legionella bononiensis TaxID=2793102 RepID=A0ABS1WAL3_9GAMM|nr:J domain-containing protein [Legionella bononiensis]MBL7480390.1 DnaJ domain-containing protein [Legionella bononiensis]MBL7526378.1 DnaJ domain-containing protein [Legionella bononiensis]MBL7563128.1 DnaJ domain-containing protein [Legionella bononiensis]